MFTSGRAARSAALRLFSSSFIIRSNMRCFSVRRFFGTRAQFTMFEAILRLIFRRELLIPRPFPSFLHQTLAACLKEKTQTVNLVVVAERRTRAETITCPELRIETGESLDRRNFELVVAGCRCVSSYCGESPALFLSRERLTVHSVRHIVDGIGGCALFFEVADA